MEVQKFNNKTNKIHFILEKNIKGNQKIENIKTSKSLINKVDNY